MISRWRLVFPMPVYNLDNGPLFVYFDQSTTDRVDDLLSVDLQKYFLEVAESERTVEKALAFSFEWCSQKMLEVLRGQRQVCFFQTIFVLHELSCPYTETQPGISPVPAIGNWEFGIYRRVLKLCLEQACDLVLTNAGEFSLGYIDAIEPVLSELICLGSLAIEFSSFLAEEKLSKGSFLLSFDKGRYDFQRTERSKLRSFRLLSYVKRYKTDAYDRSAVDNFVRAVSNCFGIEFDKIATTIALVQEHYKDVGGRLLLIKSDAYPLLLEQFFGIPAAKAAVFLQGLTLSRSNKLSLQESIYRTDNLNRYLYRPILLLNVDGKEFSLIGQEVFAQSIVSLCMQAFGWRKFPIEWKNECFERYVEETAMKNDAVLEDAIEAVLVNKGLVYDRNILNLLRADNRNLAVVPDPGEIDFLFIYHDILYIAESKHQLIRYDMSNFDHDSASFTKTYNKKLAKKVDFIKERLPLVVEHFRTLRKDRAFGPVILGVEGLFIINTPSFVLFENALPVFGLPQFRRYLEGDFPLGKIVEIEPDLF